MCIVTQKKEIHAKCAKKAQKSRFIRKIKLGGGRFCCFFSFLRNRFLTQESKTCFSIKFEILKNLCSLFCSPQTVQLWNQLVYVFLFDLMVWWCPGSVCLFHESPSCVAPYLSPPLFQGKLMSQRSNFNGLLNLQREKISTQWVPNGTNVAGTLGNVLHFIYLFIYNVQHFGISAEFDRRMVWRVGLPSWTAPPPSAKVRTDPWGGGTRPCQKKIQFFPAFCVENVGILVNILLSS